MGRRSTLILIISVPIICSSLQSKVSLKSGETAQHNDTTVGVSTEASAFTLNNTPTEIINADHNPTMESTARPVSSEDTIGMSRTKHRWRLHSQADHHGAEDIVTYGGNGRPLQNDTSADTQEIEQIVLIFMSTIIVLAGFVIGVRLAVLWRQRRCQRFSIPELFNPPL